MRTVITGASGLLGSNLAIALGEAGHEVRCTRRGASRVDHLEPFGLVWVDADLGDADALARAFESTDVVFHCAAAVEVRRRASPGLLQANVEGTRRVLDACERTGVKRLVHCSSVAAVGVADGDADVTEEQTWNLDRYGLDDGYSTSKRLAEELVLERARNGSEIVVANPSYMIGPFDARPSSGRILVELARGKIPGMTRGFQNFVDVRDVARGMMLVAEKGRAGERYILSGHNMTYADFMRRVCAIAGVVPPRFVLPRPLGMAFAALGDLVETVTGHEQPLNVAKVRWSYTPRFHVSCAKARQELGYTVGPIDDAIRDALAWFRSHGTL